MSKPAETLVRNWIQKAENDLKIGQDELGAENPVTDMICYHMQQCVEKYLKAYLVWRETPFRRTHDIAELIELCRGAHASFEQLYQANADSLTVYGTEVRYPDSFYMPTIDETQQSIEIAIATRTLVRARLSEEGLVIDSPPPSELQQSSN